MIMKIEKISDNQIRCTLTRADLADRQLQLSELAYGTEKAKSLFRDMMQQAAFDFQNLHLLPLLMPGKRILRASWKEQKVYSICSERFRNHLKHRQQSLPRIPHPLPVMIQKKRIPVTISGSFLSL